MTSGKTIGAFALTEPHAGSDPVAQSTTAVRDGDHYILNGTKCFIASGKNAGLTIVTAKTDEANRHAEISAFLVKLGTPGMTAGKPEDKMGLRASDTTDLIFDNCRIPAEHMLGCEGDGFGFAMSGLNCGRTGIAAQSIGVAGGVPAYLLDATGCIPNGVQTDTALFGILAAMTIVPLALYVLALIIILFYKFDEKAYLQVVRELAERNRNKMDARSNQLEFN